jgi:hypothetical protein
VTGARAAIPRQHAEDTTAARPRLAGITRIR